MKCLNTKVLRTEIFQYTKRSNIFGSVVFLVDVAMYVTAIAGTILLEALSLRIVCSVIAGFKIASLFVIAHDAAHASLVKNRLWNKVIARLAFLPCYHNYSLWLRAHNQQHHQSTNVQGVNSWSPLSKQQYDALPKWRRVVEQLYRSPWGIAFNYLVERWWKDKFFPYRRLVNKHKVIYWLDFLLACGYLFVWLCFLMVAGVQQAHTTALALFLLAFIVPLLISNFMIGFTVYQQHTHETIPWFRKRQERDSVIDVEQVTMYVRFPRWYNLLSHNAMEHTAHHVDPRIPLYNLPKAQKVLVELLGGKLVTIDFSFADFLATMRQCKLYDYDKHRWLDFNGLPNIKSDLINRLSKAGIHPSFP